MNDLFSQKILAILVVSFMILSCKTEPTKESQADEPIKEVAVKKDLIQGIDPALDPLIVGKEFSKVFADTLNIQMYELTLKPGDSIGLHMHPDHTVYVLEGGTLRLYVDGVPTEHNLQAGLGFFSGPLTDSAINIGDTTIKLLTHEIHRPR